MPRPTRGCPAGNAVPAVPDLAIGLPPVVAAGARRSWPVSARLAGVAAVAGSLALSVAWLESESLDWYGKTPFEVHPPGKWVAGTQTYGQFRAAVRDGRECVKRYGPGWLTPETWAVRRLLTLVALLAGVAVGCALFRPWRTPPPGIAGR